jgi:nucleotide-binding universal stress UspA family protein
MIEIRRILCPVDFSDYSRGALDHALAIARLYESTVTVLHVVSGTPVAPFGPGSVVVEPIVLTAVDRDRLLAHTKTFAETDSARGIKVDATVREGNAAGEIVELAIRMKPDLLVIGTHGRSGFDRLLLGSVAEKVLRKASCPVMTVPRRVLDAASTPGRYKRILCPVDFSGSSLLALKYATSMAQKSDGQLTVLHVVAHEFENTAGIAAVACDAGMTIGDFLQERDNALRRRLREVVAGAPELCRVDSLMTCGKPWREVLRVAAERQTDLIVMGGQGHGAIDLFILGSTTQHVVRQASCPVLMLRCG